MKTVVIYYSGKGGNRYLANKTAEALGCEAVGLKPRVPALVMPATMMKISFGLKPLKIDFGSYDRVVLCGPLYVGNIAAPCSDFIKKYGERIKLIDFMTFCASTDEKKDEKFGYNTVFKRLKEQLGDRLGVCRAFPVELILSEAQKGNDQATMNTHLREETFNEAVRIRLNDYVGELTGA